jgi:hypothetical protein
MERSFSYDQLTGSSLPLGILSRAWVMRRELDDATYQRLGHLGRFCEGIANSVPRQDCGEKVSALLTEERLQRIWRETADDGDTERPSRPLLSCHFADWSQMMSGLDRI